MPKMREDVTKRDFESGYLQKRNEDTLNLKCIF